MNGPEKRIQLPALTPGLSEVDVDWSKKRTISKTEAGHSGGYLAGGGPGYTGPPDTVQKPH